MKRNTDEEMLEIIQAKIAGKVIQIWHGDGIGWGDRLAPEDPPNFACHIYRIKPEPVEPRRCMATIDNVLKNDPWGGAWLCSKRFENAETVQLIELTPEVIAAIDAAGIKFDRTGIDA